jgi:hypothetical protein
MGKSKSRANGDGDVFPRKNKAGRSPATGGPTQGLTANAATSRARPRRRRARSCGRPGATRSADWSSTQTT